MEEGGPRRVEGIGPARAADQKVDATTSAWGRVWSLGTSIASTCASWLVGREPEVPAREPEELKEPSPAESPTAAKPPTKPWTLEDLERAQEAKGGIHLEASEEVRLAFMVKLAEKKESSLADEI